MKLTEESAVILASALELLKAELGRPKGTSMILFHEYSEKVRNDMVDAVVDASIALYAAVVTKTKDMQ